MNAQDIAERPETNIEQHPATDAGSLLNIISRAASDPSVDIDKMERLMGMHERLVAKAAERAFNAALTDAQAEMQPVRADSHNKQTNSKYASYAALDGAVRPIYTKHGFSLSFDSASDGPDAVKVLCYVAHREGHTRTYSAPIPADGKGAKGGDVMTRTHAVGSAFSYGQRYLLGLIFNLAVTGKRDDDGNAASAKSTGTPSVITADQVKRLQQLIAAAGTNAETFCEIGKIDAIENLRAADFDNAANWLNERIAARRKKAAAVPPDFDRMERGQ